MFATKHLQLRLESGIIAKGEGRIKKKSAFMMLSFWFTLHDEGIFLYTFYTGKQYSIPSHHISDRAGAMYIQRS